MQANFEVVGNMEREELKEVCVLLQDWGKKQIFRVCLLGKL